MYLAQLCYERYILFTGTIFYYPDGAPRLELNFQRINFLSRNENLDIEIIKFLSFIFNFPPDIIFIAFAILKSRVSRWPTR